MDSTSMFSLERWDLAPGEAISQSRPIRALPSVGTLLCPAPTLDTDEFIAHNAASLEGSSSMDSLAEFGLAPGEVRSQSPYRTLHRSHALQCPPPTLDTQEFIVHNASLDGSSSMDALTEFGLAKGEVRSQSPDRTLHGSHVLQCPPPTLDTQEFIAHNASLEGSSSMDSLAEFGLAPGEVRSQSPYRTLHGSYALQCPPPTLDTQEFIVHNASLDGSSSMDSLAEFGLAPGEVLSQSPYRTLHGSHVLQCPPQTLDTQEFEKDLESADPWIVEDSQAPGEHRSQCPLDLLNDPNQFCPPLLGAQEFENNRIFSGDLFMVEDSLPPWDFASSKSSSERPIEKFDDSKSEGFPSSVDALGHSSDDREQKVVLVPNSTPVKCVVGSGISSKIERTLVVPLSSSASKRSLSLNSPHGDSRKAQKQVKLESGANFSDEFNTLLPVSPTRRSICGEGQEMVPKLIPTESLREQSLKVAKRENLGPILLPPPSQMPPTTVPPTISDMKPAAKNVENVLCSTSLVRKSALTDITNSKVSEGRPPKESNCKDRALGSPTNNSADYLWNLSCERVLSITSDDLSENHEVVSSPANKVGLIIPVRPPAKNGVISNRNEEGHGLKVVVVDAKSCGEKTGYGAQVKAKVQTSLGFQPVTSRKSVQQDVERDNERWLCPRDGKNFGPTMKQLSLDRWTI